MANNNREIALAGIDVRLSVDGNNMYGAMTDAEGYFTITNIPKGDEYIIQIATSAIKVNGKPKYADFHEQLEIIERADNVIPRPFYMPLVDTNGIATITANKETKLVNMAINADITVPAGVAKMNGMDYTGDISLSEVPKALAPIALPERARGTATLLTLQPAGLRFTSPVRVSFPNRDNFPAGTELDIFSVNPDTGLFEKTGKGRVNADRTKIETFEGGITAATWHLPSPANPDTNCPNNLCSDENDIDCESCSAGSKVDLLTGVLREEHSLASYRSLNKDRVLTLGYNSKSAHPYKVVLSMERSYPVFSAIPPTVSSKVRFRGFDVGTEIVTDSSFLFEDEVEPFILKHSMDIPFPKTGIYRIDQIAISNYEQSKFLGFAAKSTSVIDETKSPYGRGWRVSNLHRLYIDEETEDILLVRGNSYQAQFVAYREEESNVVRGGKMVIIKRPPVYLSPRGDYSRLTVIKGRLSGLKIPVLGYKRTTKYGMVYNFSAEGLLISEEDRNGNKTSYCYYKNTDRLKCIKDPNGMEYTFAYDSKKKLETITDPQGRITRFEHDMEGNLIKITDPDNTTREFSYNDKGLMTAQMDKRGYLTNYLYNEHDQVIRTIRADGSGVGLSSIESLELPESEDEGTMESPLSVVKSEEEQGSYTDFNGNTSEYVLNKRGQFTRIVDALGRQTNMERDVNGNRTSLITGRRFEWLYSYDDKGNEISRRQVETGNLTSYSYSSRYSQITSLIRPNGDITRFEYDNKGNLIKLILPDDSFHTFKYNKAGLMTESKDPEGNINKYFYDRLTGNLIAQRDSLENTMTFKLDKAGNIIEMKDAKGNIMKREYDKLNRLLKSIDGERGESLYTYDKKGNLMSLKDERGNTTSYVYDVLDRMIERTNPLSQKEFFTYDDEGYMTSYINRQGELTTYNYDKANQLVQRILGNDNTYNYSYDRDGNLVSLSDNDSKLSYEYDALDRITKTSTTGSEKQRAVVNLYEYDRNNNRISLRTGLETEDEENYRTNIYTYDEENQLTSLNSPAGNFNFEYDDLSRMTKMIYPNGMETRMSFEGDMRLSKIEHIKTGLFDRVQSKFSYLYDNNDNKTRLNTFRRTLPINETLNYTYDKKNQLLTATNPLRSVANESFTYDLAGNLLKQTGQTTNSNYNENNQLTDDGTYIYKYDMKGNMIERINKTSNKTTRYEWDIENQLIKVTTHETENAMPSETITYAYDGLGRRIEKNINGKTKSYIYDNEDILAEFDEEGLFEKYYVHGMGIDKPLAMLDNEFENGRDNFTSYYYHKDGMGSITSLTDKEGKEAEKYVYNAFGKMTIYDERDNKIEASQFDNPYSFTGREHDSETGLHYHRARYYNPEIARWISEDPIGFDSGDMNLYRYVENNPLYWIDPYGEKLLGALYSACKPFTKSKIRKFIEIRKKFDKCLKTPLKEGESDADRQYRCDKTQKEELAKLQ